MFFILSAATAIAGPFDIPRTRTTVVLPPQTTTTTLKNVQQTNQRIQQQSGVSTTRQQTSQLTQQVAAAKSAVTTASGPAPYLTEFSTAPPQVLIPAQTAITYIGPANSSGRIRNLRIEAERLLQASRDEGVSIFVTAGSLAVGGFGRRYQAFVDAQTNTDAVDESGVSIEEHLRHQLSFYHQYLDVMQEIRDLTGEAQDRRAVDVQGSIYGVARPSDYDVASSGSTARGQNYSSNQQDPPKTYHTETITIPTWELRPKAIGFDSNSNAVKQLSWSKESKEKQVLVEDKK
jgi:hypothetical protein